MKSGPRRVLVTGAARRVGRAIALRLGEPGTCIAVHHHTSARAAADTCSEIQQRGGDAFALQADLSTTSSARAAVREAIATLGGLDLLVCSAASFERVPVDRVSDVQLHRTWALNAAGPIAMTLEAAPALAAAGGSVVLITCSSAARPMRNYLPYVVAKGALRHAMQTLALELAPDVRVNAVAPGVVLPPDDADADTRERLTRHIPLARSGNPKDVAEAVAYLAGARFVTGHELVVDGGRSASGPERPR